MLNLSYIWEIILFGFMDVNLQLIKFNCLKENSGLKILLVRIQSLPPKKRIEGSNPIPTECFLVIPFLRTCLDSQGYENRLRIHHQLPQNGWRICSLAALHHGKMPGKIFPMLSDLDALEKTNRLEHVCFRDLFFKCYRRDF